MKNNYIIIACSILLALVGTTIVSWQKILIQMPVDNQEGHSFNGEKALQSIQYQVSLGPRIPGTQGHRQTVDWITADLSAMNWEVETQKGEMLGHEIINIIGKRGGEVGQDKPWIILGAHYDTRIYSDQDPDPSKRTQPVPGANDGASGIAVLMELARVLPKKLDQIVWLVFFDAEDNGNISEWDWILGSRAFVQTLQNKPDAAVIVDMIGDADLEIFFEQKSDAEISKAIWDVAAELGFAQFVPQSKYQVHDDHVPFLEAGIRAVDIIDFDYPYWHTTHDTVDKVSAESLEAVGETIRVWLLTANP
jgi:glutaminyl-peptide cyclotransferase